ncbi:tryptophan 7-halogenase, partial [Staphylococcus aureus]|nr:tryptophan 7-halogenase [Staphylococcus aureus]
MPIIGVGEGTWPTMRNTLAKVGITESDFIRSCDAAFKQGARFVGWTDGTPQDGYYHPLNPPAGATEIDMAPHWQHRPEGDAAVFADWVDYQAMLCDAGLAPKTIVMPEYAGHANYAYHLDAGKFADFLRRHCCETLGVRHVLADVEEVLLSEQGDIRAVRTAQAGEVTGDLFVDCTGFRSLLLGEAMEVPFKPLGDVLFCDTALAIQVPYDDPEAPIASH